MWFIKLNKLTILKRKTDNEDLLKKCFEFDWANNKLQKFIKKEDEMEKIKAILRNIYPMYKDCYKYYASLQPLGINYINYYII